MLPIPSTLQSEAQKTWLLLHFGFLSKWHCVGVACSLPPSYTHTQSENTGRYSLFTCIRITKQSCNFPMNFKGKVDFLCFFLLLFLYVLVFFCCYLSVIRTENERVSKGQVEKSYPHNSLCHDFFGFSLEAISIASSPTVSTSEMIFCKHL